MKKKDKTYVALQHQRRVVTEDSLEAIGWARGMYRDRFLLYLQPTLYIHLWITSVEMMVAELSEEDQKYHT